MEITVQTIVDAAINFADMKYSQFINTADTANSELMQYVNIAYKDLYQQIVLSKEFYYTTSTTINLVANTDFYDLPDDFYKLDGVDLYWATNQYITLKPIMFKERNKYRNNYIAPVAPFGQVFEYLLFASKIQFLPQPYASGTIKLWYTPEPVVLTSYSDTINMPIGSDEYMSLYVAMMMLAKEETDVTPFNNKRMQVLETIRDSFKDRDQGSPSYIVDDSNLNAGAWYPFLGRY